MNPSFIDVYQGTTSLGDTSPPEQMLTAAVLGLTGEAGEVADLLKKSIYRNKPLDREKVVEELGDVLWYLARLATLMGVSIQELAWLNWKKLANRHPTIYPNPNLIASLFPLIESPAESTCLPRLTPPAIPISGGDTSGTSATPENRAVSAPPQPVGTSSPRLPEWVSQSLAYEPVVLAPRSPGVDETSIFPNA